MSPRRRLLLAGTGVVLLASAGGVVAQDLERGQMLYENHCQECHDSVVHVRETREASTRADVRRRIVSFARFLELGWGEDEVTDVLNYLNARYYGFGKGPAGADQAD